MKPSGRRARGGQIILWNLNGALAQQAFEAGVSASRLAHEQGGTANLLFKWRWHYRAGLFDEAAPSTLLTVSILQEPARRTQAAPLPPARGSAPDAGIQIAFNDCAVRIRGSADVKMLRAVLVLLRR